MGSGSAAQSIGAEVRAFGIKVTLVEPAAYATDCGKSAKVADMLEPYADFREQMMARLANLERGDPQATAEAILRLKDVKNPELRLGLGTTILPRARPRLRATHRHLGGVGGRLQRNAGQAKKNTAAS